MPTEEQTYREGVKAALEVLDKKTDKILSEVRYTNGKVRKIIIALVLVFGILIGQHFSPKEILQAFLQLM